MYTAVNECQAPGICQNGVQCTDLESGYSCTCTNGYSGNNCEIDPPGKKISYSIATVMVAIMQDACIPNP
jgi:hypothetical protein